MKYLIVVFLVIVLVTCKECSASCLEECTILYVEEGMVGADAATIAHNAVNAARINCVAQCHIAEAINNLARRQL